MTIHIGDLEIHVLRTGRFRLDGGAMFGVVPKTIWARLAPPDERNRIGLGLNCPFLTTDGKNVLVDTGIGRKWDPKLADIYGVDDTPGIEGALAAIDVPAGRVDFVLNTHLHFDHAGGNTRPGADGKPTATFPNARYLVQRGNLEEEALAPHEMRKASYLPENFVPIRDAGRLDLIEGDREVFPGVSVVVTGGHQKYHQAVIFRSRGEGGVFLGDIVPTAAHVNPSYIMAYDHYPLETLAAKKTLLGRAADERWTVILEHEPDHPVGRVARDGAKFRYEPLLEAA